MKATIYVSEFQGVNCMNVRTTAHADKLTAEREECDVTELTATIPDNWSIGESEWSGTQIYDERNMEVSLLVNFRSGRWLSVSAVIADGSQVIARRYEA